MSVLPAQRCELSKLAIHPAPLFDEKIPYRDMDGWQTKLLKFPSFSNAFGSVFLWLAIKWRNIWQIPFPLFPPKTVQKQKETSDSMELPRVISGVAVRPPLFCMQTRRLARLGNDCVFLPHRLCWDSRCWGCQRGMLKEDHARKEEGCAIPWAFVYFFALFGRALKAALFSSAGQHGHQ